MRLVTLLWLLSTAPALAQPRFDPEAETEAYLARVSEEDRERSDAYFEGGYWLQLLGYLYTLGIAWFLLASRLSARMRDWAVKRAGSGFFAGALYMVQYGVATFVLGFPLTLYQGFIREHRYGLANQSFGPWMRDQLVALGVGLLVFSVAVACLYVAIRRAGRRWWLWGAVGAVVFMSLLFLIGPVFIAPLFNRYEPLDRPEITEPILSLARANSVPAEDVYQFDASRQSKRISANVSGFLATMRISLNDNLLERCSLPEVRAVMAHEIGHYVLNHVWENIVFFGALLAAGFAFVNALFGRLGRRWGERFGVRDIGDVAGLPLLAALFATFVFLMTPVTNSYIRANEAEADLFGLNAAREPDGFAEVALKLGEYRKLSPGPLEEILLFDHPSGRSRIAMAMRWKGEQQR